MFPPHIQVRLNKFVKFSLSGALHDRGVWQRFGHAPVGACAVKCLHMGRVLACRLALGPGAERDVMWAGGGTVQETTGLRQGGRGVTTTTGVAVKGAEEEEIALQGETGTGGLLQSAWATTITAGGERGRRPSRRKPQETCD